MDLEPSFIPTKFFRRYFRAIEVMCTVELKNEFLKYSNFFVSTVIVRSKL